MPERYKTPSAVMLFLFRGEGDGRELLLHKRRNTGYMDGFWDVSASGHVEAGETMREAMAREAMEELGISIPNGALQFEILQHSFSNTAYVNVFFSATRFTGAPRACEPEKCAGVAWFPLSALPDTLIPARRQALGEALSGARYCEWGWERP